MHLEEKQPWRLETVFSVLLIILVTLVTYGYMLPKLGFYRDDWYMIWSAQAQGVEGVISLFKSDRPFIGALYAFDYSLLGQAVINWQVYALLIKLLGGLALYWLLRMLWAEKRIEATFAVLIFLVYPGFSQQPNAALFKNLLLAHMAAILSLALTVYSTKLKNIFAQIGITVLALILAVFYLVIYEAMIGIEVVRLLLVGYLVVRHSPTKDWRSRIASIFKRIVPFLIAALGFVYWRFFIFQSTRRATNVDVLFAEYSNSPLHGVLRVLVETVKDFFDTTIFAWTIPLYQSVTYSEYRVLAESLLLAALAIGLLIGYVILIRRQGLLEADTSEPKDTALHMIVLGALAVLVTSFPIVIAGRDVNFSFQWDRYTVQSTLGVALIVVGFVFGYVRPPARWVFLLALIGSGVLTQFHSAAYYRDFWTQERNMWWQLAWRAPDLQPGTTVIAAPPPGYRFLEEYEVWGPLNIVYNPGGPMVVSGQVPFDGIEGHVIAGEKEKRTNRGIEVLRDYSKSLVISKPTLNSCVHVINGQRLELPFGEDSRIVAIAPYSRTDLIVTDAAPKSPSNEVFGREPAQGWCYYYQKIDLARQIEDWDEAAKLADEAERLGFSAADRSEWLPIIEAYINVGRVDKASELAQKIKNDNNVRVALCDQMRQTTVWPDATDPVTLIKIVCGGNT